MTKREPLRMSDFFWRTQRLARAISNGSNLRAVIPLGTDTYISIITVEDHHGRQATVYRGEVALVDGSWVVLGKPEVTDFINELIAADPNHYLEACTGEACTKPN